MIYLLLSTPVVPDTIFCNALTVYETFKYNILAFIKPFTSNQPCLTYEQSFLSLDKTVCMDHTLIVDNEMKGLVGFIRGHCHHL